MTIFYKPQQFELPFFIKQRMEEAPHRNKIKRNILYISANPKKGFMDQDAFATTEFSRCKINYLQAKGHNVTGAYASTVEEFKTAWNAIGKDELKDIDKVIIDYHGAISPKRGYESVILLALNPHELLDKYHIAQLESKPGVKTVSFYACYSGFAENFCPAVGFLAKLSAPDAYTVGFDAQGNNDMGLLKTTRHYIAGEQFDKALTGLNKTRSQFGRVKYSKVSETEIMMQHQGGNLYFALSKYMN